MLRYLGVLHLNIEPRNISIDFLGRAILSFYEPVQLVSTYQYETWRGYMHSSGRDAYQPPEMRPGRAEYGTNADVWSMGVVFLEIFGYCYGPFFKTRSLDEIECFQARLGESKVRHRLPIAPIKFCHLEEKFCHLMQEVRVHV